MRRLYTTFPSGRAGGGLLLLRVSLAVALLGDAMTLGRAAFEGAAFGMVPLGGAVTAGTSAALVALGLLTPVSHLVATLFTGAVFLAEIHALGAAAWLSALQNSALCPFTIAIGLMTIGPGAYSIDSVLFGRREIHIPPRMLS